jgi:membrane-associated phospholipid phosphatase
VVDYMMVGYLGATVLLVLAFWGRIPHAPWVALAHAGMGAIYVGLKLLSRTRPRLRLVYQLSPMAITPLIFSALGLIIPYLRAWTADAALAEIDIALLGSDPTRWFDGMPWYAASTLQYCYLSYYFMFVFGAVVFLYRRRFQTFFSILAVINGCLFTTYIGYYLIPALGPRSFYTYPDPLPLGVTALAIHNALDAAEGIKLNAFPSGHTALSVLCLLILTRIRSRLANWSQLPVMGLIIATIALRYHYAIDIVAGLACALFWFSPGMNLVFRLDGRPRLTA